jgi:glycine cleavage system H protein
MNPKELKYTTSHMWIAWDEKEGTATVGITDYAQSELGDIVFFELPEVGLELSQFDKMGELESMKTVADLISPLSGVVVQVNEALLDSPELANEDPYGDGWLAKLRFNNISELDNAMTDEQYEQFVEQESAGEQPA